MKYHYPLNVKGQISSDYHTRNPEYQKKTGIRHHGIDIVPKTATEAKKGIVVATVAGKIVSTKVDRYGGWYVGLEGDDKRFHYFWHVKKFLVKEGQRVVAGQPIAVPGKTGWVSTVRAWLLHYEFRKSGAYGSDMDPLKVLAGAAVTGITTGAGTAKKKRKYITVERGDGMSQLAKRAGFKDYARSYRWTRVAKLNGYKNWQGMQSALETGKIPVGRKVIYY